MFGTFAIPPEVVKIMPGYVGGSGSGLPDSDDSASSDGPRRPRHRDGPAQKVGWVTVGGIEGMQREVGMAPGESWYRHAILHEGRRDVQRPVQGAHSIVVETRGPACLKEHVSLQMRGDARRDGNILKNDGSSASDVNRMKEYLIDKELPFPESWNLAGYWRPLPQQRTWETEATE